MVYGCCKIVALLLPPLFQLQGWMGWGWDGDGDGMGWTVGSIGSSNFNKLFQSPLLLSTIGFLTGSAMIFEHPRRHTELLLYVIPRASEAALNIYKDQLPDWLKYLSATGYGDTLLFCAGKIPHYFIFYISPWYWF